MSSFLITFKPDSESPDRGFPAEEYRSLVHNLGNRDTITWRFRNKHATQGDRVFLLLQGNLGPAILGYGRVAGLATQSTNGQAIVPIKFERLVDPAESYVLVSKEELLAINGGDRFWRINFSGVHLSEAVGASLEALIVERARSEDRSDAIDDLGSDVPERRRSSVWRYSRDPRIRERVKKRANGKCEFCGQVSFTTLDGTLYLECHHIIALAEDGEDRMTNVIALFPRDHREAHFGGRGDELEKEMIQILRLIEGRI